MTVERPSPADRTVAAAAEQISAHIGGETLILDLSSGAYVALSGVGVRVWELLGEPRTVREIESALLAEFEVDARRCREDLDFVLHDLESRGLLETR